MASAADSRALTVSAASPLQTPQPRLRPATDRAGSLRAIFGVNLTILAKRTFAAHATFPE